MSAEMSQERPLAQQPRLLEFPLKAELREIIQSVDTQVINLIGGGNVPETPKDIATAIYPTPEGINVNELPGKMTDDQRALVGLLPTIDDIPWHMYDQLVTYNNDNRHEKKLRYIDTSARIQEQFVAIKDSIERMIEQQVKEGAKNIVFTVCGASPPDLQIIRAIQALNKQYRGQENMPHLYAAIFLPGDEESVIDYSVLAGIHPEFWKNLYDQAKADDHIFIHEPEATEAYKDQLLGDDGRVSFAKLRQLSKDLYEHNRAGNVDINRTLTEVAARPPVLGIFAESLATPKQFLGSGIELIARHIWLLRSHNVEWQEIFESIQIVQHGFVYAMPWTVEKMQEIYEATKEQYDGEAAAQVWPRIA